MSLTSVDKIVEKGLYILYLVFLFLLFFGNAIDPSLPMIILKSKTVNQAKERDTFICNYIVTDARKLSGYDEAGYIPKIKECFCELKPESYHCSLKLYSENVEYDDSIVHTTIILDDDRFQYVITNSLDKEKYQDFRPRYSVETNCPVPDTLSIIISRDSIPLVSYSLRRDY